MLSPTVRDVMGFGSTDQTSQTPPTSSCRRINRHIPTLPSITETPDESPHESSTVSHFESLQHSKSHPHCHMSPEVDHHESIEPNVTHHKLPEPTSDQAPQTKSKPIAPTIHVHNPPSRLRQTTLDLFLNLPSVQSHSQHATPTHSKDRVSSTVPALVTMSSEMLQKCTGFRNITKITKLIKQHAAPTIDIQDLGRDPFLSRGEVATLPKSRRNTSPIPRPDTYGSIIHYDIGYGSGMSIGGYTHVLFLVDRATRKKFIYCLKSLHSSHILPAMSEFIKDLGCYPSKMLADRDFKIIGDQVKALFRPNTFDHGNDLNFTGTHIAGAPQGRQNQNGLSEGNWKYICNMARNFLTENLLPRQFWFHALKYAVQVSNYLPVKLTNGNISTPHELAHGIPPDYRKLIPLFAVAYTKVDSTTATQNDKLIRQTVPTILIGNDDQSDGCLFYNPATKSIISSSDYRIDTSRPSGPVFNLPHEENGFGFSILNPQSPVSSPSPPFALGDQVYCCTDKPELPPRPATVLTVPLSDELPYTLQLDDGQVIEALSSTLSPNNPSATPNHLSYQTLPPWLTHGSKVTVFFTNKMLSPKQGYLHKSNTNQWSFIPGRANLNNNRNRPIPLPNFETAAPSLIQQHIITEN